VTETKDASAEPISLEEVARAAQELSERPEPGRVAEGLLELVRRWAAPSAVLAAVRDSQAPSGLRLLPALTSGSVTLGIEKTLARLGEDDPESLKRPTIVRGEEVPGVRVRDNVVVPWWCEADSGLLVLRGVPRPVRPGLCEALALVASVVWPRVLGSPAARIEALLTEIGGGAARLEAEVDRQLERLRASVPAQAPAPDPDLRARIAELEEERDAAQQQRAAGARELEIVRRERDTYGLDLAAARQQASAARRELEADREGRSGLERELKEARSGLDEARRQLGEAGRERDEIRRGLDEAARERDVARQQLEEARRELEAARRAAVEARASDATSGVPSAAGAQETAAEPATAPARADGGDDAGEVPPDGSLSAVIRVAIGAVRRAAFVPPLLRVSIEELEGIAGRDARPARRLGVVLLDRDVVGLEPVAAELEQSGVEVRLGNQPEELALLLRSPQAAQVDAVVCDVMSFRPDQNVAGLLRGWDKDRPGLFFYLSYDAQSGVELERARRTPMSLTAGHISRPLTALRLAETFDVLARRLGR
jgi:hypothetical protein